MKLLVDAHCFDYETTEGINTYIKGIYSNLITLAKDIDFYFVAANIDKVKQIFGEAKNVFYIPLTSKNKYYRLLLEYPSIIKKYNIDFAHFQYTTPWIKNCKTIVTLHDILFKDYPQYFPLSYRIVKDFFFSRSAKNADILLTVSNYSKKRIAKHYGIAEDIILVTPNAVSNDFCNTSEIEAKQYAKNEIGYDKYILYVSRIEPRKNHISLLKAYLEGEYYKRGYDLVLIGRKTINIPEFDSIYDNLDENRKSHIHIYEQVSDKALKYFYKAASLFVYPAFAEGFGIPPLEAGMSNIPCICSNLTAMQDFKFFEPYHIDSSNYKDLIKSMDKILIEAPNCTAIREEIINTYNWGSSAEVIYTAIKQLMK